MRILSLDIGAKTIGVAISGIDQNIIFPLSSFRINKFSGKVFFDSLKKHLGNYWEEIDVVVLGNGRDKDFLNPVSKIVDQVEKILKSWTDWEVFLISETFSSIEGRELLNKLGFRRNKARNIVDSFAALIFLKDYFDNLNKEVLIGF